MDSERNVYAVQFEAEAIKQWNEIFEQLSPARGTHAVSFKSEETSAAPVTTPPPSPARSQRAGTASGRAEGLKASMSRPGSRRAAVTREDTEDSEDADLLTQMRRHSVAVQAASDPSFELLVGHLILAVFLSNLIRRRRKNWRRGFHRRSSVNSQSSTLSLDMRIRLKVELISARGLRKADWYGTSDSFCRCTVKGNDKYWVQTPIVTSLNPRWNFRGELPNYHEGAALEFVCWDDDGGFKKDFLGRVELPAENFFPGGFEGELQLKDTGVEVDSYLYVRVNLASQEAEPARYSEKPRKSARISSQLSKPDPAGVPQPNVLVPELEPLSAPKFQQLSALPWPPPLPETIGQ